ncbi:MAG TPA: LysM domain-containing protein, partial [Anaerolineales bacterium]
ILRRDHQLVALSVLLALSFFAALLPQAALAAPAAATTCTAYHTIRSGDSTARIAHTYGLTWKEIAAANKLAASYTLKVGARLCIPAVSTTSSSSATTGARFTVNLIGSGDRFSITTAGFSGVHKFNVKVRDASTSKGTWYVLGRLSTEETSKNRTIFTFPSQLAGRGVAICLKDLTTDDLICNNVSRLP